MNVFKANVSLLILLCSITLSVDAANGNHSGKPGAQRGTHASTSASPYRRGVTISEQRRHHGAGYNRQDPKGKYTNRGGILKNTQASNARGNGGAGYQRPSSAERQFQRQYQTRPGAAQSLQRGHRAQERRAGGTNTAPRAGMGHKQYRKGNH